MMRTTRPQKSLNRISALVPKPCPTHTATKASAAANPFIFRGKEDVQILVVPAEGKEVRLPKSGKKGGADDWVIKQIEKDGCPRFVIASASNDSGKLSKLVDFVLGTKHAVPVSEESIAEANRPLLTMKFDACLRRTAA